MINCNFCGKPVKNKKGLATHQRNNDECKEKRAIENEGYSDTASKKRSNFVENFEFQKPPRKMFALRAENYSERRFINKKLASQNQLSPTTKVGYF